MSCLSKMARRRTYSTLAVLKERWEELHAVEGAGFSSLLSSYTIGHSVRICVLFRSSSYIYIYIYMKFRLHDISVFVKFHGGPTGKFEDVIVEPYYFLSFPAVRSSVLSPW